MMNQTPQHPFVVGEQYRNEDGVYTVLQIEEPEMEIKYEDGRTLRSSIRLQRRIWERIQHEEEIEEKQAAKKKRTRRRGSGRSRASFGRDFHGLTDDDFRSNITGTSWRRRTELAGLLALRLSDLSGLVFESHAVYRRAEVYIVQPEHWNPKEPTRAVKFFYRLSEQDAAYGFLIEKSDEPMDATWDWQRLLAALAEDKGLQARTLVEMESSGLRWTVEANTDVPVTYYAGAKNEALYLQRGTDGDAADLDWDGFAELLRSIPEDAWCDLYLSTQMEKADAIAAGVGLASEVANVFNALLPLYAAAVRR